MLTCPQSHARGSGRAPPQCQIKPKLRQQLGNEDKGERVDRAFWNLFSLGRIIVPRVWRRADASNRRDPGRPELLLPPLRSSLCCDVFATIRQRQQCRQVCSLRTDHGQNGIRPGCPTSSSFIDLTITNRAALRLGTSGRGSSELAPLFVRSSTNLARRSNGRMR